MLRGVARQVLPGWLCLLWGLAELRRASGEWSLVKGLPGLSGALEARGRPVLYARALPVPNPCVRGEGHAVP